ncbi:ribosome maturation factor RimM [Motiliproteus coralliicola]|uniref:Ribosome maturation factor RimM n=1 Tax=Motiliproteus coralliicola TaxID=2283196 RepID=A0A369WT16_9GAMM|nr:ribosome maturation factor RimM [Motiliproteus coralliicola]RDE22635.1 ribosome maturation factor RimM [Motiliproteus coralliicola]
MAVGDRSKASSKERVVLGKITSVYGVRGWVKVYSHTEPMDNILNYNPWYIELNGRVQAIEVDQGKRHGKGLIAKLVGCDDREVARSYCGVDISVDQGELPELEEGDYYWHQLEQLNVVTESGVELGRVDHLIATGSNDVLVVRGTAQSIDKRERMIPYLPDQVVKEINLEAGTIRVDWDPEF